MKTFRKILFWSHLVAGLAAGLAIGVMFFTGTLLAFEKELVAWAERDARHVEPPAAGTPRLTLDELQRRFREARPEARPNNLVVQNDPRTAVAFSAGNSGSFHVNPYTGEVRAPASTTMARLMQTMGQWHRYLGFGGAISRPRGKLVNGVGNLTLCLLAVTGLYLWMPRTWSWRGVKAVAFFNWKLAGRARDFNWHNTIGLWSAPVLIVLSLTAIPLSFPWGGPLLSTLAGTPPAASAGAQPAVAIPQPPPGAQPLPQDVLLAAVQKEWPQWRTITLRLGGQAAPAAPAGPVIFTVREAGTWPRTANTMVTLNPFTGDILSRAAFADRPAAQRVRAWSNALHTGEALGWGGQLAAGLACLGGCFLVYTGFALAWRRFFSRRSAPPAA